MVLDLHTTAKANAQKLGTMPEMWSFDEESGKWKMEKADMEIDGQPAPNAMRHTPQKVSIDEVKPIARRYKKKGRMKREVEYDPDRLAEAWITPEKFLAKLEEEGEKSLAAPVKKFGYWNIDLAYSTPNRAVLLKGSVINEQDRPMCRVQIQAEGKDYYGLSPDTTDADGQFSGLMVQFDSTVEVRVMPLVRSIFFAALLCKSWP